jgi:polyisoprenoid-binding protein YceI
METVKANLVHYVLDARASRFTVQAFATGMLSAMGHNPKIGIRTFRGEVDFNSEAGEGSGLLLWMQTDSLGVLDDMSEKDRREIETTMNERVLEVAKFPEIVHEAPSITVTRIESALYSALLDGKLSFHGVTRSQPVSARVAVFDVMLRASGEFMLRQSEYGIKPVSVAGGALKVKDELKFTFEIVARKQD